MKSFHYLPDDNVSEGTLGVARSVDRGEKQKIKHGVKRPADRITVPIDEEHAQWIKNRRLLAGQNTHDMQLDEQHKLDHALNFSLYQEVEKDIPRQIEYNPHNIDLGLIDEDTTFADDRPITSEEELNALQNTELWKVLDRFFTERQRSSNEQ